MRTATDLAPRQPMGKLLLRYILIDILAILMPVILLAGILIRQQNAETLRQYLDTENISLLQTEQRVESTMLSLRKAAQQIASDESMTPYQLRKGDWPTIQALKKLEHYRTSVEPVSNLALMLNDDDRVYLSTGMCSFDTFASTTFQTGGTLTQQELYDMVNSHTVFGFLPRDKYLTTTGGRFELVTYPLKKSAERPYGTLIGILDATFWQDALEGSEASDITYICTSTGQVVHSSDADTLELPGPVLDMLQDYTVGQQYYTAEIDGQQTNAVVHYSGQTGWYYIRLTSPADLLASQTAAQRPLLIMLGVVALALVVVTGVLLALYSYLPIRKLFKLFSSDIPYQEKRSELLLLNDLIVDLQWRNTNISQQLQLKELTQLRSLLKRQLDGGPLPTADEQALLERHGLSAAASCCLVCLLPRRTVLAGDSQALHTQLLSLQLPALFLVAEAPENCFLMLYCGSETDAVTAAEQLCATLNEERFYLRAGVGSCAPLTQLRTSLDEGILALEINREDTVAVFSRLQYQNENEPFWQPRREELLLRLALQRGDSQDAIIKSQALEASLNSLRQYHHNHETRFILYRVMGYLQESPLADPAQLPQLMEHLVGYRGAENFFAVLQSYLQQCVNRSRPGLSNAQSLKMQEMLEYIDANYCQPQMSLAVAADRFGVRDSYFSKLFKEYTGINFIDYLSDKRLEECCRLLRDTDMTIQAIVQSVGYTDLPSFSRKFSRKYGMSPGAYRKSVRGQGDTPPPLKISMIIDLKPHSHRCAAPQQEVFI